MKIRRTVFKERRYTREIDKLLSFHGRQPRRANLPISKRLAAHSVIYPFKSTQTDLVSV